MSGFSGSERFDFLNQFKSVNSEYAAGLNAVIELAKLYFDVPAALVSLDDDCNQALQSNEPRSATETNHQLPFCHHVIQQDGLMVVPDARLDERFAADDFVTGIRHIRFYAGVPIVTGDGTVGTLCIIDREPRKMGESKLQHLTALADMVATFLISYSDGSVSERPSPELQVRDSDNILPNGVIGHSDGENSRHFLELILENIPDVVFVKDAELRHIQGNQAFLNLFPEEMWDTVIGTTGTEEFGAKQVEAYQAKDREALENGQSITTEDITLPSGETHTFRTKKIRFEGEDGEVYLLGLARDITEAREAERRIDEASEFQNLMFEHMPDLIFVKDEEFKIVQANKNFLNVYPEDMRNSVIGTTTLEQYNEVERIAFLEQDQIALDKGFSETEENIDFPDGTRRYLLTRKVRFEDQLANKFILGIGRDITELVEIRRELEVSLELLNNVFNAVSGAVIGLNVDREVLTINNAGRHMLAGNKTEPPFAWPDEIIFLDPADMQPLESSHDPIARALIGQEIGGEVHLMTSKSLTDHRYVRVTSALVRSRSSPLRTVIVLDDVSIAERNRQQIERQSRLDALGQLTGGIAHDFNNLLNTMQYAIELIRRDNLSERSQRSAAAALKSINRGSELTNRLLAFAKKQPKRATARPMRAVFSELKELVAPALEASLTVNFPSMDEYLLVYCDQGQLQNAVLNLILNSRDAIMQKNKGHLIKIDARAVDSLPMEATGLSKSQAVYSTDGRLMQQQGDKPAQRYVEISVSDNGPGMSKAVASRALDPFFTTKDVNSGTGLGLSMVYGFVEQSDGELRIYTEENEGTTIRLYLPRGDELTGLEAPVALTPLVEGQGETILIVEDEEPLLEQLNELLRELNYKTMQAPSGRAAVELIRDGARPDLILTDVVMPGGIGGFELARIAREIVPDIRIIYMSGYTGFTDEEMGEVVAPLLPKPASPSMTSTEIRAVLDGLRK